MAGDVGRRDAELVDDRGGVRSLATEADRPLGNRAPGKAAPVVVDEPVPISERSLLGQRPHRLGDVRAMDEQHGRSRALPDDLVLELEAVDGNSFHQSPPYSLI